MMSSPLDEIEEALQKAKHWDEFGGEPIFEKALAHIQELRESVPKGYLGDGQAITHSVDYFYNIKFAYSIETGLRPAIEAGRVLNNFVNGDVNE